MATSTTSPAACRPLEWLNFFVADVQTGLGPFLAAYLAANSWSPLHVGYALTLGGIVTVLAQTPVGGFVDWASRKRSIVALALFLLSIAALTLTLTPRTPFIYTSEVLIGLAGAAIPTSIAAITLGITGQQLFDRQFGRNQSFNSAGNVAAALLIGSIAWFWGVRWIFVAAIVFAMPAAIALSRIDPSWIDNRRARAAAGDTAHNSSINFGTLLRSPILLAFLLAAFLFHLSNAAMLPQLGELLSHGHAREAAPFMSACIIVTQCVITFTAASIGKLANRIGRKPFLLAGFACLPVRGLLYAVTHATALLIAIQILDGIANSIFGVVTILSVKDLTRDTGRFNLVAGALATFVGIGAALSPALGGEIIQHFGYPASFLALGAVGVLALLVIFFFVPETLRLEPLRSE